MPRDYVKLVSKEGFEFIIDYRAACISNTIKNMLSFDGSFTETEHGEVTFSDITTPVLERVCQYFYYKMLNQNPSTSLPEFQIKPEMALELLMAADYLDA
eukprot:jgi/Ulvmu1/1237/UM109_0035.1